MRLRLPSALRAFPLCASVLTAACGGGSMQLADITPERVPALEAERTQRPADPVAMTRLGVGYFRANQLPQAHALLDSVVAQDPQNGVAAIFLGMTAESQGDFTAARGAYEHYIEVGRDRELANTARQRRALLGRRELEFQARQALAQEAELSQAPPDANTIAVMPFAYTGTNAEIAPLSRGFAQLIVTDLAKSQQLRVLERERMQAMVDEMRLDTMQQADPASAARSGRLLRASRVVQGTIADRDEELRVVSAVVDVNSAGVAGTADEGARLNQLFDLEKTIVFDIFNDLGIQLTDAERAEISQRPTQNLQAFLAWSRGLEAEDRGDYVGAQDQFNQAQRLDPSFAAASQSAQQASDMSAASTQSVQDVDLAVTQSVQQEATGVSQTDRQAALQSASTSVNPVNAVSITQEQQQTPSSIPTDRDPTSDATRTETILPSTGTVVIVIRRP
jgi:TolB-like protein